MIKEFSSSYLSGSKEESYFNLVEISKPKNNFSNISSILDILNFVSNRDEIKCNGFWTSTSIVYSYQKKKVKLIFSKGLEINKLLDLNLLEKDIDFKSSWGKIWGYDDIVIDNKDVFEFDWNKFTSLEIKNCILNKYFEIYGEAFIGREFLNVMILKLGTTKSSQWRPIYYDVREKNMFANMSLKNKGNYLFNM